MKSILLLLLLAGTVSAQSTQPTTMRALSEVEVLRSENRRMLAEIVSLRKDVDSLGRDLYQVKLVLASMKQAIAQQPTPQPSRSRADAAPAPQPTAGDIQNAIGGHKIIKGMTYAQCMAAMGEKPASTTTTDGVQLSVWQRRSRETVTHRAGASGSYGAAADVYYTFSVYFSDGIAQQVTESSDAFDQSDVIGAKPR